MDQTEEYQHGLYSGKLEKQRLDFFQVLASQLFCRRDLPIYSDVMRPRFCQQARLFLCQFLA